MKLFTTGQIANIDKLTLGLEPIAEIDLMERAALQITNRFIKKYSTDHKFIFFVGPGNNGGDGLAVARQMADLGYDCEVRLLSFGKSLKGSPAINRQRLEEQQLVEIFEVVSENDFPNCRSNDIVVDALFGSGLTRPLEGVALAVVQKINALSNEVVSIDIPSGLMGEDNAKDTVERSVKADITLTLQFPKLSMLFPENEILTGRWEVLPIGLHPMAIEQTSTSFYLTDREEVMSIIPKRSLFAHKGSFGHALLVAGSRGKMGAAVLASTACLRAGIGLLTSHIPKIGETVMQTAVPEAMINIDSDELFFTETEEISKYSAVGVGPGLGMADVTKKGLWKLIEESEVPLLLDADALNIIAEDRLWMKRLPEGTILTPHPGEFSRLAGHFNDSWSRIKKLQELAVENRIVIVLKGAFTVIALPNGDIRFNSTGNPGMATGGSGDVLTGVILGLLAQGVIPEDAATAGVWIHGRAGDLAAEARSEYGMIAGDITAYLGDVFLELDRSLYES